MVPARSALAAVQSALYARLSGDAVLGGMVTGIYDHVPEGTAYPYVVVGEAIETADNSLARPGRSVAATLHVWSKFDGYSEATRIADRVTEILDHQPLDVAGHIHISTELEYAQTLRDPDPEIRHLPMRFRVRTEQ